MITKIISWPTWKSDLKYAALGLVLGCLLGACSPTQFSHPTSTAAQLDKDKYECEAEARKMYAASSVQRGMYRRCMDQRGYSVVNPS